MRYELDWKPEALPSTDPRELRKRLVAEAETWDEARITDSLANLEDNWFACDFVYVNNSGVRCNDPKPMILAHFFNHQTHHRGQIHDMLSQTDVPPPPLDLHRILRPDPTD